MGFNVCIAGATGNVGRTMISILEERNFPVDRLRLLASARSVGKKMTYRGTEIEVEELTPDSFEKGEIVLSSPGGSVSKWYAPSAAKAGALVIDNTSAFRMYDNVPLVVPEVNPEEAFRHEGIIANPNCSTIQMVVALQPLHEVAPMKRVVAATYQAVSGAGKEAVEELQEQSRSSLDGKTVKTDRIPHVGALRTYQIAFNLVPQLDVFTADGYSKEEVKMMRETRKIMSLPELPVTATTVRVPVINGHSIALNVEMENSLSADEARDILSKSAGVTVIDNPALLEYPTPLDADGYDDVFVGRIRADHSVVHGLNLWVVSDNIRKGAATNSIQIAELLLDS